MSGKIKFATYYMVCICIYLLTGASMYSIRHYFGDFYISYQLPIMLIGSVVGIAQWVLFGYLFKKISKDDNQSNRFATLFIYGVVILMVAIYIPIKSLKSLIIVRTIWTLPLIVVRILIFIVTGVYASFLIDLIMLLIMILLFFIGFKLENNRLFSKNS